MMVINTSTRSNQVKEHLLNYIDQNNLKRDDQLPSEASIAKMLGVSRNTVREAYVALEKEGVIVRRHGIGTFVAHSPVIQDSLNDFSPFADIIKDSGYVPHFKTLSMRFEDAPSDVHDLFAIPAGQKLRCIQRIVLADQQPVIYVNDYFSPVVETATPDWDAFDGNTVRFLSDSIRTPLHQIKSCIRAALIPAELAAHLDLPEGTPVLSVRSTIYTVENEPVAYSKIYFNSEIVSFNIVRMIRAI